MVDDEDVRCRGRDPSCESISQMRRLRRERRTLAIEVLQLVNPTAEERALQRACVAELLDVA